MNHEQEPRTEQNNHDPEASTELGRERRSELEARREIEATEIERSPENQQERAVEARERAASHAIEAAHDPAHATRPAQLEQRGPISQKQRDLSFSHNMTEVRRHMKLPSRAFSKIIHNKAVERTSEVVGGTIARPNAILSGAVFAFIIGLSVYLVARRLGYPLSGFESILSFIVGWVIGLLYDYIRVMIIGKKIS